MIANKLKDKIRKIKPRTLSIFLLVILLILSVLGIIFSSVSFNKNVKSTHAKELGNKLNISYDVNLLGNSKPNINDQDIMKKASESINKQLQNRNLQDYDLEYGIGKDQLDLQNAYLYGNLNMSFNLADKELGFDQKLLISKLKDPAITSTDKINMASQLLSYFYKFNNNFNYRLQNNNAPGVENKNFTTGSYALNSRKDAKTKPATGNTNANRVDVTLLPRKATDHKGYWDLSEFQKAFVDEFKDKWNELKDHKKVIDSLGNDYVYKTVPVNSYNFWINRSVLISRLQVAIMLTYLYEKFRNTQTITDPIELFIVNDLIKNLTLDEKNFGYWVNKLNNQSNALFSLNKALEFDSSNNVETTKDPLLELLSNYYTRNRVDFIPDATEDDKKALGKTYQTKYEFLYSWNTSKEKLINSYIAPIDYANFFNFFKDDTKEFKDQSIDTNQEYYTSTFFIDFNNFNNVSQPNALANIINDYSFEQSIFNRNLYNLQYHISNPNNVLQLAKKFINYVSVIEQKNLLSPIKLPTYLSTFIGVFIVIILIGIIVSIFYKVPGAMATIFSLLNFTLASLLFTNLGLSFSFDTFLVLGLFAVLSFLPLIFYFEYFKEGIRKGYNIWNAFVFSFKKSFRVNIRISITILIIGLSFLLFGVTLFQSFGSILVIYSLMTICLLGFGFSLIFFSFLFSLPNTKFNLFLNKDYKEAIIKIQNSIYRNLTIEIPEHKCNTIYEKVIAQFNISWKSKRIWYLVAIGCVTILSLIGLILLGTIGFGLSSDFSQINQIIIKSNNALNQTQINLLALKLNLAIYNVKVDVANDIVINTLQISNFNGNWNDFINLINNVNFTQQELDILGFKDISSLINTLTIGSINNTNIFVLKNNLIKCLLISIAFVCIWVFLTLNIVNVVPVFILILFNIFVILGIVLVFRIPFNKDSLFSLSSNYIFNMVMIIILVSYIKDGFKKKRNLEKLEIKEIINSRSKEVFNIYLFIYISFILSNLLYMLFVANAFVFVLLLISITTLFLMFVNIFVIVNFMYWTTLILKLFTKEQQYKSVLKYFSRHKDLKNEIKNSKKQKSFDKVDEQEIYGINKF